MNANTSMTGRSDTALTVTGLLSTLGTVAVRAAATMAFLLMAMAEPFFAVILSALALGCFAVSVLFGFIFHAPFQHRWYVLGASVVFLMMYVVFRFAMLGAQKLMR